MQQRRLAEIRSHQVFPAGPNAIFLRDQRAGIDVLGR
jgi:hypothetical protein